MIWSVADAAREAELDAWATRSLENGTAILLVGTDEDFKRVRAAFPASVGVHQSAYVVTGLCYVISKLAL